jgi:catechol 2,3-dioxygenase-like lactoylglutathione lyase family enzyme
VHWQLSGVTIRVADLHAALGFYRGLISAVREPAVSNGQVGHTARLSDGRAELELISPLPRFPVTPGSVVGVAVNGHFTLDVADLALAKQRLRSTGSAFESHQDGIGTEHVYVMDPNLNFLVLRGSAARSPNLGAKPAGAWMLHHVNIQAPDLDAACEFYGSLLGTVPVPFSGSPGVRLSDGAREIHLSVPGPDYTFADWHVNPTLRGHFALTVPDVVQAGQLLAERGVCVDDRGDAGLKGFRQLYCYDPGLNLVELNQPM